MQPYRPPFTPQGVANAFTSFDTLVITDEQSVMKQLHFPGGDLTWDKPSHRGLQPANYSTPFGSLKGNLWQATGHQRRASLVEVQKLLDRCRANATGALVTGLREPKGWPWSSTFWKCRARHGRRPSLWLRWQSLP